jgi:hypothetical protein
MANIILHAFRRPEWRPGLDAISNLIYNAQSVGVNTVNVDWEIILEAGQFTRDAEEAE